MGDKISARRKMIEAGVPVVPGTQENLSGADEAVEACRRIGFPVMLKASQGGGGKGMRLARSEDEVREAFVAARAPRRWPRSATERSTSNASSKSLTISSSRFWAIRTET